jgi:hypothetical protein
MATNEKVSYHRAIGYVDDEQRRVAGHIPRNPRRFVRPGRTLPQPAQEVGHR